MDSARTRNVLTISGIALTALSLGSLAFDASYRAIMGISFANRDACFLYSAFNDIGFLVFENTVELGFSVYAGCFFAVLVERYLATHRAFAPGNPLTAFALGSIIPVCSCTAIPLASTMGKAVNARTMIAFLVAAPLLNPYLILLSFSVLGPFYAIARIASAGILSISAGYVVGFLSSLGAGVPAETRARCDPRSCRTDEGNAFARTMRLFLSILPPLALGAIISVALELLMPDKGAFIGRFLDDTLAGDIATIAVGIPLYLCNGADVFILRPFMREAGLSTGTALEFSLSATAICVTSILILSRVIGKRLTAALVAHLAIVIFILGNAVNYAGGLLYGP